MLFFVPPASLDEWPVLGRRESESLGEPPGLAEFLVGLAAVPGGFLPVVAGLFVGPHAHVGQGIDGTLLGLVLFAGFHASGEVGGAVRVVQYVLVVGGDDDVVVVRAVDFAPDECRQPVVDVEDFVADHFKHRVLIAVDANEYRA